MTRGPATNEVVDLDEVVKMEVGDQVQVTHLHFPYLYSK